MKRLTLDEIIDQMAHGGWEGAGADIISIFKDIKSRDG